MVSIRSRVLVLLTPVLALLLSAGPLHAQRDSAFMKSFRSAMKLHDTDAMAKEVKGHQLEAIKAVMETCGLISEGSSDELEEEIDALGRAWKKAFGSDFVSGQYVFFSLMDQRTKVARRKLLERYRILYPEYEKAVSKKDKAVLPQLGYEFEGLAKAFAELGDGYMASSCAWHMATCFEEEALGKEADLRKACEAYALAVRERERIDLKDSTLASLKARFQELEYAGYGDPSKGPEARAAEKAKENPAYAPHAFGGVFEVAPDCGKRPRLIYEGDPIYQVWFTINLGRGPSKGQPGSTGTFPSVADSPKVIREGYAKVGIDTDGDGKGDVDLPVTGKEALVQFNLPDGRPWAFRATVGLERDTYQGLQPFNIAPSDDQMVIYISPAASIVGMIEGVRVQIFDDSMDGRYGGEPLSWGALGTREGDYEYVLDSVLIGDSKTLAPFSAIQKIGDAWYRFETNKDGADVTIRRTDITSGKVKLEMKGASCDYLILKGTGNLEGVYVNIASKGGVEVPEGTYELLTGRISKGKRDSMRKALICNSKATKLIPVRAGQTTKVELGAPFGFDFQFSEDEGSVTVRGETVVVTGRGGEVYERFWNCIPHCEASVRAQGAKKGGKAIKMVPAGSQEEMAEKGWKSVWFPLDVTIPKAKKGKGAEVQLTEKKNKLFGKIVSEWKGV
ncbi:MAG TPA: hypothetical protein ENJ09_15855 [Planctomycetes bacterium]|nr:hypothetical protein [Planctomycetota bacterium]